MNQMLKYTLICIIVSSLSGFLGGFIYALIYDKPSQKTVYLPQYEEIINQTQQNSFETLYTYYNEDINKPISGNGEFSVVLYNNRGISFRVLDENNLNVTVGTTVSTKGSTPNYTAIKIPFNTGKTGKLTLQYNTGSSGIIVNRIDYISPDQKFGIY